ncbi:MAG TPA: response regulator [Verrucomicrobiae bacterium]|nr:response regulator [Verrucomicrobiae bacterium]
MRPGRKFHILVAEDDPNDRFFVEKAFKMIHGPVTLTMVEDGEAIEHYLLRKDPFTDSTVFPFPGLIMLDIKMPKRTGLEVLAWMTKTDLRRIPVMMVSSSDLQCDIDRAFDLGANAYLVKPITVQKMQSVFQVTADFWTTVSEWPSQPNR